MSSSIDPIMGLNFIGHDPSVGIVVDGRILAYADQERFTREKHAVDRLPIEALKACLHRAGLKPHEVSRVAFGWDCPKYANGFIARFFEQHLNQPYGRDGEQLRWQGQLLDQLHPDSVTREIRRMFRHLGAFGASPEIHFVPHHWAHACSAFLYSGFNEALVITADGCGDEHCTVAWRASLSGIQKLQSIDLPHSLGWFYSMFTRYLGFTPGDGEWKLMGLAAYGSSDEKIARRIGEVLDIRSDGTYRLDQRFTFAGPHSFSDQFTDRLVALLDVPPRLDGRPLRDVHRMLAWAVQDRLEQALLAFTGKWAAATGLRHLCLAGGVHLNCKANQRLSESSWFDHVFIQPLASDAGLALGAPAAVHFSLTKQPMQPLTRLDLGPAWSNEEIVENIQRCGLGASQPDDIAQTAAQALAAGLVVGWFQGGMEAGPRALGQRSILADPRTVASRKRVNEAVKSREGWRPFCPSILVERVSDLLLRPSFAPFMVQTFSVRHEARSRIPAVVHADGTTRPQVVARDDHPLLWRLIDCFEKLTGVPAVLNTSFNVRGEPIVCSPVDAIRCYYGSGMDALAIGPYWLQKPRDCDEPVTLALRDKSGVAEASLPSTAGALYSEMVVITAGPFIAGEDGKPNESPRRTEELSNFLIDVYPVTNAAYARFLDYMRRYRNHSRCHPSEPADKDHIPQYWRDHRWNNPVHPVVGVDWWDAYAYAGWVGKRLPTEWEWEKAARGVRGFIYPWGDDWEPARCNSREASPDGVVPTMTTTPVDRFISGRSQYGVMDLAGNVWEWTANVFDPDPRVRQLCAGEGPVVIRGGSFRRSRQDLRCSFRDDSDIDTRGCNNGFRCAKDINDQQIP